MQFKAIIFFSIAEISHIYEPYEQLSAGQIELNLIKYKNKYKHEQIWQTSC